MLTLWAIASTTLLRGGLRFPDINTLQDLQRLAQTNPQRAGEFLEIDKQMTARNAAVRAAPCTP